jgi:hypothetical protein
MNMPATEYTCSHCGAERAAGARWFALRLSGDRRGVEIRPFEARGPDDQIFCGASCAFERIEEIFGGPMPPKK